MMYGVLVMLILYGQYSFLAFRAFFFFFQSEKELASVFIFYAFASYVYDIELEKSYCTAEYCK